MSPLLDAIGSLLPTGGRKSRQLLGEGEAASARVVGIRIRSPGEGADRWEYALEVLAGAPFRAGCRQSLSPIARTRARLGALVPVRHRDGRVIIDEPTLAGGEGSDAARTGNVGWKALSKPPADGVEDQRLDKQRRRAREGRRVTARVDFVESTTSALGMAERWDVGMTVSDRDAPHAVRLERASVPEYARELLVVGAELPIALDPSRPDRAIVDWEAAAVAHAAAAQRTP